MGTKDTLFPIELPEGEWLQFPALGYAKPVCGFLRRRANPPTFGMPLGSIDTGCLGINPDCTLGLCSIFNSYVPMRGPLKLPFLGITVGKITWVLSTIPFISKSNRVARTTLEFNPLVSTISSIGLGSSTFRSS